MNDKDRDDLRAIARASIRHGLAYGRPLGINPQELSAALQAHGASFVTLEIDGALRGCIGTLEAHRPLAIDVSHNAFAAAFQDSRFPPLSRDEEERLDVHLSVLSRPQPMLVRDEADLLRQLRPGVDGLVLSEGARRATFLPSVWEQLPDPREFVMQLKRKAGLPGSHWSLAIRVERYTSEAF